MSFCFSAVHPMKSFLDVLSRKRLVEMCFINTYGCFIRGWTLTEGWEKTYLDLCGWISNIKKSSFDGLQHYNQHLSAALITVLDIAR